MKEQMQGLESFEKTKKTIPIPIPILKVSKKRFRFRFSNNKKNDSDSIPIPIPILLLLTSSNNYNDFTAIAEKDRVNKDVIKSLKGPSFITGNL